MEAAKIEVLSLLQPRAVDVSIRGKQQLSARLPGFQGEQAISCPAVCVFHVSIPGKIERDYRGSALTLRASSNNTISVILESDTESLVSSILVSEGGGLRQPEALKAFAVLVRTFLSTPARHAAAGADFCDTTHCQVFRGAIPDSATLAAAAATAGMVLTWHDRTFRPYYSAVCGGQTATYRDVWGADPGGYPFFAVPCPACAKAAAGRWTAALTAAQMKLVAGEPVASVLQADGFVRLVLQSGSAQSWSPENFRILVGRELGWNLLRSNLFEVRSCGSSFCFEGIGRGHRVGLCQYGGSAMAAAGSTYKQILSYYFPGTELRLSTE